MNPLTPRDYEMALLGQSACNLSGLVLGFAEVMPRISAEVRSAGGGSAEVAAHPICRLYAEQIAYLAGVTASGDLDSYHVAYTAATAVVEAAAKGAVAAA